MKTKDTERNGRSAGGVAASSSIVASVLAAIGASCCVLPLLLIQLGVGAAVAGSLTALAPLRPWFLLAAVGLLGWAAFRAFRGGRPRMGVIVLLTLGSAVVVVAVIIPAFEGDLLRWARNL
jgi:mercuric ion transport protein